MSDSPAESIGAHLRWQVLLVLIGALLLATLLGYSAYSVSTTLVPDQGGVFREGEVGNPQYLNPLLCQASEVDMDLCALLYRGLTQIDKHGRVVPDLAEEWTTTDGAVYTFRLKQDQFWHDGEPITADDVIFTFGVLQDPDLYSLPGLANLWRSVTIEKLDDYTVRFTLAEPFTPFLDYTAMGLLPEHIWNGTPPAELATSALDIQPIGSGPLKVVQIEADHIRLEPNPFYPGKRPYLDALELHFYPDVPSLFAAYEAGEIEGVSQIPPVDIPALADREDLQLFSSTQSSYLNIVFNLNDPNAPFLQDKLVRQALYYGIDREQLIDDVANGQGIVAHSILLPENWAYNPDVRQYNYDPGQARQLLDEAGWIDSDGDGVRDKDGQPLQFLLHTNDDALRAALIERIAADWRELGVNVVATPVPFSELVGDLLGPRHFDAALIGWEQVGDPDPYPLWHSTQAEGGGQNYSGWDNPEADQIMEQARAIVDPEKRKELYWQFQDIFADELPALPLYYPVYTYGVNDKVYNVQMGSINQPSERFKTFADWYMVTRRAPANQAAALAPPTPPGATPVSE